MAWAEQAGLSEHRVQRILREQGVRPDTIEQGIRSAAPKRYPETDQEQLERGIARLRAEFPHGGSEPRPSTVIVAIKSD